MAKFDVEVEVRVKTTMGPIEAKTAVEAQSKAYGMLALKGLVAITPEWEDKVSFDHSMFVRKLD